MGCCGGPCSKQRCALVLKVNLLVLLTVVGVVIGFVLGFSLREASLSQDAIIWLGIPGEVYMRMLKMMILPLIISSIIAGTASLDPKCNGRVSVVALVYIISSNLVPCVISIALSYIIKPGVGVDLQAEEAGDRVVMETSDIFADLIRNLFPDNIVSACFQQTQTKYVIKEKTQVLNVSGQIVNETMITTKKTLGTAGSTNVLGIVLCCMVFGMATAKVGKLGKPFLTFFYSATEIILLILRWFVWTTPIGVISLIAVPILKTANPAATFSSLGYFALTVTAALSFHQFVLVTLVTFLLVRVNPFLFLASLSRPYMVSFASASSAVAIPETLYCLENNPVYPVDKRISRFVVPFAATINRDGSAIYITASCFFMAQLAGVQVDGGKVILIWFLTTAVSLAVPSVPSAGVMAVLINLTALSLPTHNIGLLFALEWIIDRLRTGCNMLSHAHCAAVVQRFCQQVLPPMQEADDMTLEVLTTDYKPAKPNALLEANNHDAVNMV